MRTHAFDSVTRYAASGLSRRGSLLALGGATLTAALATPILGWAKKNKGPDCKKKEKQRCSNDADDCKLTVLLNCQAPDGCLLAQRCCEECSSTGILECIVNQM